MTMPTEVRSPGSGWVGAPDPQRRELFERALDISGAGSTLLQTFINRIVAQLTIRHLGLQAFLDRKPGQGNGAYINRRTPTTGNSAGKWVADSADSGDAVVVEGTGTYAQVSFLYRTLVTQGKVTRKMQATGKSYGDVLADELEAKADDFAEILEDGLIVGNNAANSQQINGLLTLVNAVSTQVIANTSNIDGDDLVLSNLDEAIDAIKGSAVRTDLAIVGNKAALRKVNAALQAQQQFVNTVEIAAGFRVRSYDGIPLIESSSMPSTLTINGSGVILDFTGGSTTALAIVNRRYVWIEELTPQTVMPLAKTTSQFDLFDIFWDGALVYHNTFGAALLTAILPT